jgi:EmrB/QacA subfamily drug resistance transporter
MLMMSPGLALFLYGVSSIPGEGGIGHTKVLLPGLVGLALMVAFVLYSFKPKHPLLDLRLFSNRNLTVSIITMFIFAASFFGGLLLIPQFLQQVQHETPLNAGWLVAPQGVGAMLTMPIAGALADRFPVGRIVPFGLVLIIGGMFTLTQIQADSSHWGFLIPVLFVMGLGMGATMMPIMTSALKTLTHHDVARGSTLLNITQQIASSVGVAIFSVVLTNQINSRPLAAQGGQYLEVAATQGPKAAQAAAAKLPLVGQFFADHGGSAQAAAQALANQVARLTADAYAHTFWVAASLVSLSLVAALFLPRRHEESHLLDDADSEGAPPVMVH